ncbi:hypothetical protein SS50377_23683 [Spironucleus salmonicida]|nr:hypothetical protein SS50377_23683 [Spironucleus salmonicida]
MLMQKKLVKKVDKGIDFQHEISVKSFVDTKSSFFSSRGISANLTDIQEQKLKNDIVNIFLNQQLISSDQYWCQKQLNFQQITITNNLIDDIGSYIRSIIKAGQRLRDGLNNLILCDSDDLRNEATNLHQNIQQVIGQYEQTEAQLKHRLLQDQFVTLLGQIMLNIYQEPYFNVLIFVGKILIENIHVEKIKIFISTYKFYASSLEFDQEIQLAFSKYNITSDEADNLTQKYKNLKTHLGQSCNLYILCNQLKKKIALQVSGQLQGREAAEFSYLEFKNYFTSADQDNLSIFNENQKGEITEINFIDILPFLIGQQVDKRVKILEVQAKNDEVIIKKVEIDLQVIGRKILEILRNYEITEVSLDIENSFVQILDNYAFSKETLNYDFLLNYLDSSLDKLILDDLDVINNYDIFKSQIVNLLKALQYNIERLFLVVLCENIENVVSFKDLESGNIQFITDSQAYEAFLVKLKDYIKLKEIYLFVESFKQGVDIMYHFISQSPDLVDSLDEDLSLKESFRKFKEEGFICNTLRNNNLTQRFDHNNNNQELQQQLSKIILYHPIFSIVSVNYSLEQTILTVTDDRIESVEDITDVKVLFDQINNETQPIDTESSFLYSNQRVKKTYSPHDPFSVIPFISKKPIILFHKQFARGINKQQFLFVNEILKQQSAMSTKQITISYQNFLTVNQFIPNNEIFSVFSNTFIETINQQIKDQTIKYFSTILCEHAIVATYPQAFYYLYSRIQQPGFNPLKLQKSADTDPSSLTLTSPFLPETSVPTNAIREFVAAQKGFRICVALPQSVITEAVDGINQQNMTTFVVIDSHGRYIDSLILKSYENGLPNPQTYKADNGYLTESFSRLLEASGVDRQDCGDCQVDRKKLNDLVTSFFIELNTKQLQRIIDEASLMDFLAKNAICAVGVYQKDFNTGRLKKNLENTLKYMNLPIPEYYNDEGLVSADQQDLFLNYVSCPKKGKELIVGQNLLFLNDFIYKRIKLSQFLQKIILVDIASDIPFQVRNLVDFDLTFEDTDLYSSYKEHAESYVKSSKDYIQNILKNIIISNDSVEIQQEFGQFNQLWSDKRLQMVNKFKLQLLNYDSSTEPPIQKTRSTDEVLYSQLQFTGLKTAEIKDTTNKHNSAIQLAIQAGRYLLDPLAIFCLLTQGEAQPENLCNMNLAGFLPQFMPFKGLDNQEVYLPILANQEKFYSSVKYKMRALVQFIQQLSVSKKSYDFNLPLASPHYIYAFTLIPGLTARKVQQIYQRMSTAECINDKLLKIQDIQRLLYLFNKKQEIQLCINEQFPVQQYGDQFLEKSIHDSSLLLEQEMNNILSKIESQTNKNIFGDYVEQKRNKLKYGSFIQNKLELQSILVELLASEHLIQLLDQQEIQEKGLSNLTYKQICDQSIDFSQKIKQYSIFNQYQLKEKFGYEKHTTFDNYMKMQILSQEIFNSAQSQLQKRTVGELVVDLFKEEDYCLIAKAMENYEHLLKSITVQPDVFLSIPGSPYSSPINVGYHEEFPEPAAVQILYTLNEFLKGRFSIDIYEYSKNISNSKIQKSGGPESRKIIIGSVLNKYGTDNQLFGILDVDEETTIGKKYKNYCCLFIQDNILDALSLYDRVQISEKETATIYFAILFAQKYCKSDLFEQLESKYTELQELNNLIIFYNKFSLFQDEILQLTQRILFAKYDILYLIFGSNSIIVKDLTDLFYLYNQELNTCGVFLSSKEQIKLLFQLKQKINFSYDQLSAILKGLFNKSTGDIVHQQDLHFKQEFTNLDDDEEMYNLYDFIQEYSKYINTSIFNIHDPHLKQQIESAIQSGIVAEVFKKDTFRKEIQIIIENLSEFDTTIYGVFKQVDILSKSSRVNPDCIFKTSRYIDDYSKHNGNMIINYISFDIQDTFKTDDKLIFLIQSKMLNPKQFTRFQEFKVEVPMMKRDMYRNQQGPTSIDIECLSIPGLKGSIPNGGNEEDVDLYGSFTCYLDGVDFGQAQVFLITYFMIKDDNGGDIKLKVSNFISNIHENIWRASLLEQIISTEASIKPNKAIISDNTLNLLPTSLGASQFNPKQFNRFSTFQQQNLNPQYLKKHDLLQFQSKPLLQKDLYKIFTTKLLLSYQLSDFYQLLVNQETDLFVDTYFKSASLNSIGIHYFVQNSQQFINIRSNLECVSAILSQAQKFFIDNEHQYNQADIFSKNNIATTAFKKNFIDQAATFNSQINIIDVDQPQNYEEIQMIIKLFYNFYFTLKGSNLSSEVFCKHMKFIQMPSYVNQYKNFMQASFQAIQFKRDIQHSSFKQLKLKEAGVYFEKYLDRKCVFIPILGSYDKIQVCIQTPAKDQFDYKFSMYTIYEDPNYKPQENGQIRQEMLSQRLYINVFENFPNIEQKRLTFTSLDDIASNFVQAIYKQYENIRQSSKFIKYTQKQDVIGIKKSDWAVYLSDCRQNRLNLMKLSSSRSPVLEYVYISTDGFIFRDKFIPAKRFLQDFIIDFYSTNYMTYQKKGSQFEHTFYKEIE